MIYVCINSTVILKAISGIFEILEKINNHIILRHLAAWGVLGLYKKYIEISEENVKS